MVAKVVVLPGSTTEKAMVMGGSFVTGVVLGSVSKWKPSWGMPMTLGAGILGIAGAFLMTGGMATMSEGLANASLATLGASVPYYLGGSASATSARALPAGAARRALPPAAATSAATKVGYDWRKEQPIQPAV